MKENLIYTIVLLVVGVIVSSVNANASGCKPNAITATSKITGTMHNSASRNALMQSAMNQMFRKWTTAATTKHGSKYKYHKIDDCECRVNSLALKTGDKLTVDCKFVARACDLVHYIQGVYTCKLFNRESSKYVMFRFKR